MAKANFKYISSRYSETYHFSTPAKSMYKHSDYAMNHLMTNMAQRSSGWDINIKLMS